jgi:hypothetical protein
MEPWQIGFAPFLMVLGIVAVKQVSNTVQHYLEWRMRMAERQSGIGGRSGLQVIEELRAEIAALKQHEAEAVLSFDSTLQTLDARVKHLERRALGEGAPEHVPVAAPLPAEEPARVAVRSS